MGKVIAKHAVKRKRGFLYYVDAKGNVCEAKMARGGKEENKKGDKYSKEQKKVLDIIKEESQNLGKKGGKSWNKYKGRMVSQIIIHHLKKRLPKHLRIVGRDFFISKWYTEWGAMIVKRKAKPSYSTYQIKNVKAVIEIKGSGMWGEEGILILKANFNKIKREGVETLLIIARCLREESIRKKLKKNTWMLGGWKYKPKEDEWKKLVKHIKTL